MHNSVPLKIINLEFRMRLALLFTNIFSIIIYALEKSEEEHYQMTSHNPEQISKRNKCLYFKFKRLILNNIIFACDRNVS